MNTLDGDYFIYDETHYEMVGEVTKKTYKLGQRLKVKCVDTDKIARTIDFSIVKEEESEEVNE